VLPSSIFAQAVSTNEAEEHILNQLDRARIPNAAIAVIQDGEVIYILKDSEHDTLFQIGSVAKSFTAFGVLLLEDMGLLSVSDPISKHLPGLHENITIYNLLHHTSGFTSDERRFPVTTSGVVADDIIWQTAEVELAFYPSAEFAYGNLNYVLLGLIIEAVSGQSYDEFMTRQVLHPLGLYNTFTYPQNARETGRVAGGNRIGFLRPRPHNPPVTPLAVPTGYIYSSIVDMARWVGIHLGTIEVSEQFARVVERSHRHNHDTENPFAGRGFFYAGGWFVHPRRGEIEHGGLTPGYSTLVSMLHEDNTAVVVLSNLCYMAMGSFGSLTLDAVLRDNFNSVGIDFYVTLDIILTVITAMGVVSIFMLIWLSVSFRKKVVGGEKMKAKLTAKSVAWLIFPIITIGVLVAFYVYPPIAFDTSWEVVTTFSPASFIWANIALWVIVVYSLYFWLVKLFAGHK